MLAMLMFVVVYIIREDPAVVLPDVRGSIDGEDTLCVSHAEVSRGHKRRRNFFHGGGGGVNQFAKTFLQVAKFYLNNRL